MGRGEVTVPTSVWDDLINLYRAYLILLGCVRKRGWGMGGWDMLKLE